MVKIKGEVDLLQFWYLDTKYSLFGKVLHKWSSAMASRLPSVCPGYNTKIMNKLGFVEINSIIFITLARELSKVVVIFLSVFGKYPKL